ncbi:SgcJ/EcaC family oxidoreductase [Dactylosporangium sp. CA-092794]|uniref:SgcJ/EcaC family oxidoreductase n=1 Tax=Dactylosporangium sp. CA-092794 TaxID=3239929 RepID=UPI003D8BECA5
MTDTVEGFLDRVRQAWDAGDARRYGEQFAEDASYVIFLGDVMFGRAEITATHHDVFTKWQQGTRMVVKPINVRAVDDTTTVVVTAGGIGTASPIAFDKFQTYTLRNHGDRYECVAFQNTEMSGRAKRIYNP